MTKVAQFDELKDLITETRKMCLDMGITRPTLRLSEGWAWLLDDGAAMLRFLEKSVNAEKIEWVFTRDGKDYKVV